VIYLSYYLMYGVIVGISVNSVLNWRDGLIKNVMVLGVFILCFCWTCNLRAQNGGKVLNIIYSADERGAITPCG
jgi:hypothetical protein